MKALFVPVDPTPDADQLRDAPELVSPVVFRLRLVPELPVVLFQ